MPMRREEFVLGSAVGHLFPGSPLNPNTPGAGAGQVWNQIANATWDNWALAWGDNLALGVNWDAIGTTGWDGWSLTWGT